jgi:hypothetical protein
MGGARYTGAGKNGRCGVNAGVAVATPTPVVRVKVDIEEAVTAVEVEWKKPRNRSIRVLMLVGNIRTVLDVVQEGSR